jgi:hypothetical protein
MVKKTGLVGYLMTGLKIFVVGILSGIALLIPMALLGIATLSTASLMAGGQGIAAGVVGGISWLILIPLSLVIEGYIAQKLWKWR